MHQVTRVRKALNLMENEKATTKSKGASVSKYNLSHNFFLSLADGTFP
jgi:hypothetical protein